MAKVSHREKILSEGLRLVHERGFSGASVRDIVQAAGVPQGSFTNHFASKEAFGLEILDLYFATSRDRIRATLYNDALPPLQRLADFIEANKAALNRDGMKNGCLLGNFSAEVVESSEAIRHRLMAIFAEVQAGVAYCLKAAAKAGLLRADMNCEDVAGFIVSSLQGAILLAKTERDPAPVDRFKRVLFEVVLR